MNFIHDDFMLETAAARELFHRYAESMPIVDYHCHLPPEDVANDRRWDNLTQIWLYGDHYKWRAMRGNGIAERFCTGDASDRERFDKFAETVPYLLRNPLYHWSHLELARYFGIDDLLLSPETADAVWERTLDVCRSPRMSARQLMERSKVSLVCTTDDPADALSHHRAVRADSGFRVQMLPTWRPDKVFAIHRVAFFNAWIDRLGAAAAVRIDGVADLLAALRIRHDFFHAMGCRLSDYGIETVIADPYSDDQIEAIFRRVRAGQPPSAQDCRLFQSALHYECARLDSASDWTMQIHYGALRNNNSRMFDALGPDTGFDSIGDWPVAEGLSRLMNRLDREDALPRTILYTLNPRDNEVLATMLGNFQGGGIPGKIQFGSGWWFNDQMDGMRRQLDALSQLGLLSRFVGMLTDSRSFLSYARHEYFRRLLCNMLGSEMEKGLIPGDYGLVGRMVQDVCYNNAARYFGFKLEAVSTVHKQEGQDE
jgi:glucuronate isomerase